LTDCQCRTVLAPTDEAATVSGHGSQLPSLASLAEARRLAQAEAFAAYFAAASASVRANRVAGLAEQTRLNRVCAEAFQACRYAIERVKQIAPIWKHEVFDGGDVWIEGATADPDDEAARREALERSCA